MDYPAIDAKLAWFADEVAKRYKVVQSQPNPKFQPLTFVCDEFTRWGGKCANSTDFFEQLVTDIRKVEMFGLIISHTRTLAGLANAKGFASLRDEALLEVEILGNKDEETGRATPRFEALVKLPGQSLSDRTLVKLAKPSTPTAPEPTPPKAQANPAETAADYLDRVYKLEFDLGKPEPDNEPSEPTAEPVNQPPSEGDSESEPKFTSLSLNRTQAIKLIQKLRTELNQTQVIEKLWDCKKGGSEAWRRAYAQFKELMGEGNE
jgi:hypothetical protein